MTSPPPPVPIEPVFPPPLATLAQLEVRMGQDFTQPSGEPTDPDGLRAYAALNDASAMIRAVAAPEDWLDEDGALEPVPFVIQTITLAVAGRALLNPSGAVQASVGDASVTYGRGGEGGSMFLTSSEVRAIRKAAGVSGIGSIQLETGYVPPNGGLDPLYAPVEGGGDPIPLGPAPWEA